MRGEVLAPNGKRLATLYSTATWGETEDIEQDMREEFGDDTHVLWRNYSGQVPEV